jgi:protein-arginine kinase activator protein McsA
MLIVRCKNCNRELIGTSKLQVCGCQNQMSVKENKISAIDLSQVIVVESDNQKKHSGILSSQDLADQEARRQRKVRRLDFEVR